MLSKKEISCDLCVIGGGMAGICAAISAAREGVNVVLMHERAVLGGNASSEIRMWICGARGENNRETGIIEEIELENIYRNPTKNFAIWDMVLYDFVKREKNIQLLLNCTCIDAECEQGDFCYGRKNLIKSVTGYQMTTQKFIKVNAKYFCDCSGDSILAPLTNAEFRLGRESANEFNEISSAKEEDMNTMGMSCLIQGRETADKVEYIPFSWATKLNSKDFENRVPDIYDDAENFWYLELGGTRDTIGETEQLRDELVSLASGTWDYIKNSGNFDAEKWDLEFFSFLPGKRESRRMCGEYMLTQKDISMGKVFEDEIAYGGWPLDDHFPEGFYHKGVPNTDFATPAPYSIPYRVLYSKNVENLFFAGRNISVTHMALSSTRVMATCSILGEAVGKAAALCVKYSCSPHEIYISYIKQLQKKLLNNDCFLPSLKRDISSICKNARLKGATDVIRNGEDRPNKIYNTTLESACCKIELGHTVEYDFNAAHVSEIHIVFSSDLERQTLNGSWIERQKNIRANVKINTPTRIMPTTLCKEFIVLGSLKGKEIELLRITTNRKRCYHLNVNQTLDKIKLVPLNSWGNERIDLISFDFK